MSTFLEKCQLFVYNLHVNWTWATCLNVGVPVFHLGDVFMIVWLTTEASWFVGSFGTNDNEGMEFWILKDPKTNDFRIWQSYYWHHLCIGFEGEYVSIIKVCTCT